MPGLAGRLRAGQRAARVVGTGDLPSFFHTPYGPGWALAGDAGYHRDLLTAQGISDAFRDAQLLSEAIDASLAGRQPVAGALAGYQRRRDEASMTMYELTCQRAALEPLAPQMTQLVTALSGNQDDTGRFLGVIAGTVPAPEYLRDPLVPSRSVTCPWYPAYALPPYGRQPARYRSRRQSAGTGCSA